MIRRLLTGLAALLLLAVGLIGLPAFLTGAYRVLDTQMPDLLILVGTLGGLTLFGAAGLILGPVVAALFITVWEIYGSTFRELLQPAAASEPEP